VKEVRGAFLKWKVVFFRHRHLDHAQHVAMAADRPTDEIVDVLIIGAGASGGANNISCSRIWGNLRRREPDIDHTGSGALYRRHHKEASCDVVRRSGVGQI
jgi:hypothetical protein